MSHHQRTGNFNHDNNTFKDNNDGKHGGVGWTQRGHDKDDKGGMRARDRRISNPRYGMFYVYHFLHILTFFYSTSTYYDEGTQMTTTSTTTSNNYHIRVQQLPHSTTTVAPYDDRLSKRVESPSTAHHNHPYHTNTQR
jgi:hypothetical protein